MLNGNVQAGTYNSLLYSFLFLIGLAYEGMQFLVSIAYGTDFHQQTHTHSYSATQYSFSSRIPIALLSLVIAYSKLTARVFFTVQNHLTDVFLKIYV